MRKINEENQSGVDPARAQEAMKDPEVSHCTNPSDCRSGIPALAQICKPQTFTQDMLVAILVYIYILITWLQVQAILQDPMVNNVLRQMQTDPQAGQR